MKSIKQYIWVLVFWIAFFVAIYLSYRVYFVDTLSTKSKWIGLFSGSIAILLASVKLIKNVYLHSKNTDLLKTISSYIGRFGAYFIKTTKLVLFLTLFFGIATFKIIGIKFALTFIFGVFCSILLNVIFSKGVISTSIRESYSFENEFSFKKIFNNSSANSLIAYGIILSLSVIFYHLCKDYQLVAGFAFGLGMAGFVYTSVNIISEKITTTTNTILSESEYRNNEEKRLLTVANDIQTSTIPALYQTNSIIMLYAIVLISAISVGMYCVEIMGSFLPIVIATNSLFSTIFVLALIKISQKTDYIKLFIISNVINMVIFNTINYYTIKCWLPSYISLTYCIIIGCAVGIIYNAYLIKKIFYSDKTAINISNSAIAGIKQIFTQCIKESSAAVIVPIVLIFTAMISSFLIAEGLEESHVGLWGIVFASLGFICSGIIPMLFINFSQNLVNIDLFSNLFNNELDFGLIKETGKKFLSIFNRYTSFAVILCICSIIIGYEIVSEEEIDLINPYVISSLVLGVMIPFGYIVLCINNIFKNSKKIVFEIKQDLNHFSQVQDSFDYLSKMTIKKLSENVAVDFVFSIGLILFVFFLIAIFLKIAAIAGFIVGILLSCAGIIFVVENISIFLDITKSFLNREYKDNESSSEFNDLSVLKNIFSFTKDFVSPLLNNLIIFIAILSFALIPVFITF